MKPYASIVEHTEDVLSFARTPTTRSCGMLLGFACIGFSIACFSMDSLFWKFLYFSGAFAIGAACIEEWETCTFDKVSETVTISRKGLRDMILNLFGLQWRPTLVTLNLEDLLDVFVEQYDFVWVGSGFHVVLRFTSDFQIPVVNAVTLGDGSEHQAVADLIVRFLNQGPDLIDSYPPPAADSRSKEQLESLGKLHVPVRKSNIVRILNNDHSTTGDADDISSSGEDDFELLEMVDALNEYKERKLPESHAKAIRESRPGAILPGESDEEIAERIETELNALECMGTAARFRRRRTRRQRVNLSGENASGSDRLHD